MGRSIRRSPSLKMNSKICLILFGLLVALAVLSAAENSEENSLSEEVASSRLIREAEAGKRKRNNKAKKAKKGRKNKKGKNRKNRKGTKKNKDGKRKGRKNNRGKKRNNKNRGNRKNGNRKSARTVNGKCLETAMLGMNRWRLVV